MRKFLSTLLCLMLVFTMMPLATGVAFAAGENVGKTFTVDGINYRITSVSEVAVNSDQTITKTTKTNIVIPATVTSSGTDYTVTAIGENAFYTWGLTQIAIPASVTSIAANAFEKCSSLTTVTFASDSRLETIGSDVFWDCKALSEIKIPKRVTSIGRGAFYDCTSLTNVEFEPDSQLKNIKNSVFINCTNLEFVNLESCSQLETIGTYAFDSCSKLAKITIPASVTSIGEQAFRYCSQLATVTCLATTPPALGTNIFDGCARLATIYVPAESVASYTSAANWSTYANIIRTTATGTNLNPWKIGTTGHESDVTAYLDGTTLHIKGTGEMEDLGNAQDQKWLSNRANITEVQISEGITSVGNYAFANCASLTSITIPASVTNIGKYAFTNCSSLTTVTCLATNPPIVSNDTFDGSTGITSIYVPEGKAFEYKAAEGWSQYSEKIVVTIADILATADGEFPETKDAGWVSGNGAICYLDSSTVKFGNDGVSLPTASTTRSTASTPRLKWSNGTYEFAPMSGWILTFNMEDDKLVSITLAFVNLDDSRKSVAGTYTAPTPEPEPEPDPTPSYPGGYTHVETAAERHAKLVEVAETQLAKTDIKAKSKLAKLNGKKAVKISWDVTKGDYAILDFDGFDVFRSTKRYSGYGNTPYFTTTKTSYTNNKNLKAGKTYYYKVRAWKMVDGEKVYTGWSTKAWRTVK